MYDFIKGEITELTPTYAVLENNGCGYFIHISLSCYSQMQGMTSCRLYIHQVIREDAHLLFGFFSTDERHVFKLLISVSGVGASIARMILSTLLPDEIRKAILEGDVVLLKSIKGIGTKSAERIIIDLRDKIGKPEGINQILFAADNTIKKEALSALEILGFSKKSSEKVVDKILFDNKSVSVEDLIKQALKLL